MTFLLRCFTVNTKKQKYMSYSIWVHWCACQLKILYSRIYTFMNIIVNLHIYTYIYVRWNFYFIYWCRSIYLCMYMYARWMYHFYYAFTPCQVCSWWQHKLQLSVLETNPMECTVSHESMYTNESDSYSPLYSFPLLLLHVIVFFSDSFQTTFAFRPSCIPFLCHGCSGKLLIIANCVRQQFTSIMIV